MKIAYIEAMFPELKGKYIYRTGRGEGSNPKAAISRAMGDLFKLVKGKRWSTIKCTITLTEKADAAVRVINEPLTENEAAYLEAYGESND